MGLGLMGGSLARAFKKRAPETSLRAMARDARDLQDGMGAGVLDQAATDPQELLEELDLLIYCTPLSATLRLMEVHRPFLSPGTLLTDVASLKGPVLEKAGALGLQEVYVGSHPMAGGEGSGFSASKDGLFSECRVWVVAGDAPSAAVRQVMDLWEGLGASSRLVDAKEHDVLMAWVSHLPQLSSTALASALDTEGIRRSELGPGGRDMTRLAGSSPEMWGDLLAFAPDALIRALRRTGEELAWIRGALEKGEVADVTALMERTRRWAKGEPWS